MRPDRLPHGYRQVPVSWPGCSRAGNRWTTISPFAAQGKPAGNAQGKPAGNPPSQAEPLPARADPGHRIGARSLLWPHLVRDVAPAEMQQDICLLKQVIVDTVEFTDDPRASGGSMTPSSHSDRRAVLRLASAAATAGMAAGW